MATLYWVSTSSTSFNTAANWSTGSAPANGDTVIFNSLGTANCTTNLNTSLTGITLIKEKSYTGQIGVLSGSTATFLQLDGPTVYLEGSTGAGSPTGSTLVMIDGGTSNDTTVYVYDSSSTSASTYYPPIMLKGGSTGGGKFLKVYQSGGIVGVSALPGSTSNAKCYLSKSSSARQEPQLYLGRGVTLADFTASHGTIYSQSDNAATAIVLSGDATFYQQGAGALTAASVWSGAKLVHRGTGNVPTLSIAGTIDRSEATDAITIGGTAFNIYSGASLLLNNGKASSTTRSNKTLVGCSVQDITVELPVGELF